MDKTIQEVSVVPAVEKGICPICHRRGEPQEVFVRDMHRQCLCPKHYALFKSDPEMIRKYRVEFEELNPDIYVPWDSRGRSKSGR